MTTGGRHPEHWWDVNSQPRNTTLPPVAGPQGPSGSSSGQAVWNEALIEQGREEVRQAMLALWNRNNGWIPGAAFRELAGVLGMDPALFLETRKNRTRGTQAEASY